jgi:hypothetical protein
MKSSYEVKSTTTDESFRGEIRVRPFSHATASHGLAVSLRNYMLIKKRKPWVLILIQLSKGQPLFLAYNRHMEVCEKNRATLNELFFNEKSHFVN